GGGRGGGGGGGRGEGGRRGGGGGGRERRGRRPGRGRAGPVACRTGNAGDPAAAEDPAAPRTAAAAQRAGAAAGGGCGRDLRAQRAKHRLGDDERPDLGDRGPQGGRQVAPVRRLGERWGVEEPGRRDNVQAGLRQAAGPVDRSRGDR